MIFLMIFRLMIQVISSFKKNTMISINAVQQIIMMGKVVIFFDKSQDFLK